MSYTISTLLTRNLHDVFGENDASRVGTGENVLVSCIIIATTIFRRAM